MTPQSYLIQYSIVAVSSNGLIKFLFKIKIRYNILFKNKFFIFVFKTQFKCKSENRIKNVQSKNFFQKKLK